MRWQDLKRSGNVEDRRGLRMPGGPLGGGVGALVIIVIALLAGVDPRGLLQNAGLTGSGSAPTAAAPAANDTMSQFVAAILGSTEETWSAIAARPLLEAGDVEEALTAASAIGDDRLQRQSQGTVVPETFTHGTSAQRVRWFRRGLDSGDLRACDTFNSAL